MRRLRLCVLGLDDSAQRLELVRPRVEAPTLPLVTSGLLCFRDLYVSTPRPWTLGREYVRLAAALTIYVNVARAGLYGLGDASQDPVDTQTSVAAVVVMYFAGVFVAVGLMLEIDANDKLTLVASTDVLLGLRNRRRLDQRAEALTAASRADCPPLGVMVLDIDDFKEINDRWGHDVGDCALRAVARPCVDALCDADVLVRCGGEDFAVVLPRCTLDAAAAVGQRIVGKIRNASVLPQSGVPVTVSIGIAEVQRGEQTFNDATRRADAAM